MKKNFIQQNKISVGGGVVKSVSRPKPQPRVVQKPITMPQKIKYLEKKVQQLEYGNNPLQEQILTEMRKIKEQLQQLKIGLRSSSLKKSKTHESLHEDDEPPVQSLKNNHSGSNSKQKEPEDIAKSRRFEESFKNNNSNRFEKELIPLKELQPYLKDYKFDTKQTLAPYYIGYNKKTSKEVVIKYSKGPMDQQIEVYNRLWKNIVKARWPCINKIYDVKEPNVNVMVMDKNTVGIRGLPFQRVLIDILKILEFIHESGYLYRNIRPEHFMLNEENKLVVIDFKLARRYTDFKGNHIEVQQNSYKGGDFGSNNQLRYMPEGRKDDLESLGYLALFFLTEQLPWQGMSRQQMIKARNNMTLNQLYKKFPQWLQYMVIVHKMAKNEKPDYNKLISVLEGK